MGISSFYTFIRKWHDSKKERFWGYGEPWFFFLKHQHKWYHQNVYLSVLRAGQLFRPEALARSAARSGMRQTRTSVGGTVVSMPHGPVLNCKAEGGLFLGLIRSSWDSVSLSKSFYYYVYIWHHVHGFFVKWSKSGFQRNEVPKND